MHNGRDNGRPRAGQRTGLGKNLDADGIVGLNESAPRGGNFGGARERKQAEIKGGGHPRIVCKKSILQRGAVHFDDAHGGVGVMQWKKISRAGGNKSPEQQAKQNL